MASSDMTLSFSRKPASLKTARARRRVGKFFVYAILIAGCLVTLVPFLWMVTTSLKDSAEIVHMPPTILPSHPTLENYTNIFTDPSVPLARFYMNSIIVSISIVGFVLFTSSLAGFIFAKYKFAGQNFFFTLVLATMMIPFQVTMIPLYLIIVRLHIVDSLWGLIIPGLTSAFGIFLMRQFIDGIPNELIDAARIDGCSEPGIYTRIVLPQMGAAMATLGIFQFMGTWNDYLWPLIVITTTPKRTLPVMLTWYTGAHGQNRYDMIMAASFLVIFPILVVYLLFQRWIVQGIALTGFK